MANKNNTNGFWDEGLNLFDLYKEDLAEENNQNLADLAGYNLNNSDLDNNTNDISNNTDLNNLNNNIFQNSINMQDSALNQEIPQPQRQPQTMPLTMQPQINNNLFANNDSQAFQSQENLKSFLQTQIGKNVTMQFLVGTNTLVEKSGILVSVGNNFVILKEDGSEEFLVCDFDGLKFINFENIS